jgi:shikimate kinase
MEKPHYPGDKWGQKRHALSNAAFFPLFVYIPRLIIHNRFINPLNATGLFMEQCNIALIGFRATGKSTVGEILAGELGMEFIDMDRRLTSDAGRDIAEWVKEDGWDSFRKAESGLLTRISSKCGLVVATGGGIVLNEQSRSMLRKRFFTVWLKATPATIFARLSSDPASAAMRPSLSNLPMREEIGRVLAEREHLYDRAANAAIDTEGRQAAGIACEIAMLFRKTQCITHPNPEDSPWN